MNYCFRNSFLEAVVVCAVVAGIIVVGAALVGPSLVSLVVYVEGIVFSVDGQL